MDLAIFSIPPEMEGGLPSCSAQMELKDSVLRLEYSWEASAENPIVAPRMIEDYCEAEDLGLEEKVPVRARELWLTTCFEFFLQPDRKKPAYYEINLSPGGLWNAYGFSEYRKPQPPQETRDLELIEFHRGEQHLVALFRCHKNLGEWRASLTAILCLESGEKLYFANQHRQEHPDFHWPKNFLISELKAT